MIHTKNRHISDSFILPESLDNIQLSKHESKNIRTQLPIKWDKATGHSVYDKEGNRWIDFTSGIFATNLGHSNKKTTSAIKKQLDKLQFSFLYPTDIREECAKKLLEISPEYFDKVIFASTGTEATDLAYKLIKENSIGRIISFRGSYHGRALSCDFLSGGENNSLWASNAKDDSVYFMDFPYEKDLTFRPPTDIGKIGAFVIETYQGWSAQFYPDQYMKDLYSFAKNNNILICIDEIQAGFYRCGKLYGYMTYGDYLKPDVVCIGKALGSPLPMSAVLSTTKLIDSAHKLGGTNAGNPLCCAATIANLEQFQDDIFLNNLKEKVEIFENCMYNISKCSAVDYVNARGMIGSIMFKESLIATKVVKRMVMSGILPVHTWSRSIKLGPPLTISNDALKEAFEVMEKICLAL